MLKQYHPGMVCSFEMLAMGSFYSPESKDEMLLKLGPVWDKQLLFHEAIPVWVSITFDPSSLVWNISVEQRKVHELSNESYPAQCHMEDIINKSDDENLDGYSDVHNLGALPNPHNIPHET